LHQKKWVPAFAGMTTYDIFMPSFKKFSCLFMPWVIWVVAASFYSYEFFVRVSPSVMVADLMRNFRVDAEAIGTLSALYYYAYAMLQIPVGAMLDNYGIRRLLFFAALSVALGNVLLAATHKFWVAEISRVLMGVGSAFSFVGCLKLAANWFPQRQFAFLVGLTNMVGVLGAIGAEAPLAYAFHRFGWHMTLWSMGIIGSLLALLISLVIRDNPQFIGCLACCPKKSTQEHDFWEGFKYIIRCRRNWLVALYGGLMVAPVSAFTELWSVPFFTQVHHFSNIAAAGLSSLMFLGIAVGGPVHTYLSGKIHRRKPILWVGTIGALVCLSFLLYVNFTSIVLAEVTLFLFGFFISSMLLVFALNVEMHATWANGIVIGFTNTFVMLGGTVFQPLVGLVLDQLWQGEMQGNVQVFSAHAYRIALSLTILSLVGALCVLKFIRETYCQQGSD
jgi:sugar phosphate permease